MKEDAEKRYEFVKPIYARGWVIGLLWLVLLPLGLYVWYPDALHRLFFQLAYLGILVITLVKFFRSPRKLTIEGDVVKVYTYKSDPSAEFHFSKMTCVVDDEEIFLIKKRSFTGGIVLRQVYWPQYFSDMRHVFRTNASYVKDGDYENMPSTSPKDFVFNKPLAGAEFIALIPMLYDYAMLPYLLICEVVFKRRVA